MRRRGKIGRWAAEVILAYNKPTWLAAVEENDSIEEANWEEMLEYMVDEDMEAHDYCDKHGWEYPPPEYWESWRLKHGGQARDEGEDNERS